MTRLDRLNSFLSERLSAALNEIIYTVSLTMKEYEEETARIRKENDHLKEMLKISGCGVSETHPGVISSVVAQSLLPGQEDCSSNLEQESEPRESPSEHQALKEEVSSIKREQSSFLADAAFEPEPEPEPETDTRQTCATRQDYNVGPLQCPSLLNTHAVDQEMIDYEFPAKVKVEAGNTQSATDNMDASAPSWSPQNWDLMSEKSDQSRVHHASTQQPCAAKGTYCAESVSQNRPVEFRAAFSYSNRIICSNTVHCTSRHCEMQKRTIAKSSPVWKYFSLKEGDCSKAVCLMCKAVISRGVKEYTTSALLKHLRMKHGKC